MHSQKTGLYRKDRGVLGMLARRSPNAAGRIRQLRVETGSRLGASRPASLGDAESEMSAFLAESTWDSAIGRPPLVCT
jgi:hypothetical protein